MAILRALFVLSCVRLSVALTAYSCDGKGGVRATISTVDVKECETPRLLEDVRVEQIALTQTSTRSKLVAWRCKVVVKHKMYRCGKSIDQPVRDGDYTEVMSITRDQCGTLIQDRRYVSPHNGAVIDLGRSDELSFASLTTLGYVDNDGGCTPASGGAVVRGSFYDRPVRQSEYEIIAKEENILVDYEDRKVVLANGVRCDYSALRCKDALLGNIFWEKQVPKCSGDSQQELVYKGPASMLRVEQGGANETYAIVEERQHTFQVRVLTGKPVFVCGLASYETEHPKLFVTILGGLSTLFPVLPGPSAESTNLLTFVSSKILYSTRKVLAQVQDIFDELRLERCQAGVARLQDALSMAMVSPADFAFQHMGGPGYTAVVTGEVIRIIECSPVEVKATLDIDGCYDSLPVIWNGTVWFMTPRSKILLRVGKPAPCNVHMAPQYKFDGQWWARTNSVIHKVPAPESLGVVSKPAVFEAIDGAATGGVYSADTIRDLERSYLLPLEQSAITTTVTMGMRDGTLLPTGYSVSNIMTEHDAIGALEKASMLKGFWFSIGQWLSPVLVILFFYKMAKALLNWFFDRRVLGRYYGAGPANTLSCCPSLTHHILSGEIKVPFIARKDLSEVVIDQAITRAASAPSELELYPLKEIAEARAKHQLRVASFQKTLEGKEQGQK